MPFFVSPVENGKSLIFVNPLILVGFNEKSPLDGGLKSGPTWARTMDPLIMSQVL